MTEKLLITLIALVASVNGDRIVLDSGSRDGIRVGDAAQVYYELSVGGSARRFDVGTGAVVEVGEQQAVVDLNTGQAARPGHQVEIRLPADRFALRSDGSGPGTPSAEDTVTSTQPGAYDLEVATAARDQQIATLESQIRQLEERLLANMAAADQLADAASERDSLRQEVERQRAVQADIERSEEAFSRTVEALEDRLRTVSLELETAEGNLATADERLAVALAALEERDGEMERIRLDVARLEAAEATAARDIQALRAEIESRQQGLDQLSSELTSARALAADHEVALGDREAELRRALGEEQEKNGALAAELDGLRLQHELSQERVSDLEARATAREDRILQLLGEAQASRSEITELEDSVAAHEAQIADLRDEARDPRDRASETEGLATNRADDLLAALEAERHAAATLEAELADSRADTETARTRTAELEKAFEDRERDLQALVREREGTIASLGRTVEGKDARISELESALTERSGTVEGQIAAVQTSGASLRAELEDVRARLAEAELDRSTLESEAEALRSDLEQARAAARDGARENGDLRARLIEIESGRPSTEREIEELREETALLENRAAAADERVLALAIDIDDRKRREARLEAELASALEAATISADRLRLEAADLARENRRLEVRVEALERLRPRSPDGTASSGDTRTTDLVSLAEQLAQSRRSTRRLESELEQARERIAELERLLSDD